MMKRFVVVAAFAALTCHGVVLSQQTERGATPTGRAADSESTSARLSDPLGKGYFTEKEQGWFWYKDPPAVVPEELASDEAAESKDETSEAKGSKDQKPEKLEAFSVAWLRKNMPILLDRAIDNPTEDNVSAYLYAQRVALDKAQNYAEKTKHVVANDPFLDENNRVPLSTFAKKDFLQRAKDGEANALDYLSTRAGIWMFFDSTCDFCHIQSRIIQSVAKRHNFNTRFISMNGKGLPNVAEHYNNNGKAQELGIKMTPTTVLVVPPATYLIVSQGLMAEDQLTERLLVAADSNNIFPDEFKQQINVYKKGVLTTEQLSEGASEDPAVWVKRLKEKISGKNFELDQ